MDTERNFNFDYWMELAERDPEECIRQRREWLHNIIDEKIHDEQKRARLKGILWRVWHESSKIKNPIVRMEKAATAMWKAFDGEFIGD